MATLAGITMERLGRCIHYSTHGKCRQTLFLVWLALAEDGICCYWLSAHVVVLSSGETDNGGCCALQIRLCYGSLRNCWRTDEGWEPACISLKASQPLSQYFLILCHSFLVEMLSYVVSVGNWPPTDCDSDS